VKPFPAISFLQDAKFMIRYGLVLWCAFVCLGCGESFGNRRAIHGSVRWQGAPLDQGTITFFAEANPTTPAAGSAIQNGNYKIPISQGLDPGKYRVEISSPEPSPPITPEDYAAGKMPLAAKERLPASFNSESKQTIEVTAGGSQSFDFNVP
jgi:hypothetical protein